MTDRPVWRESLQSIEGGLYRILLNRPRHRNAFTPGLYGEVKAGIMAAAEDQSVTAIVIEGVSGSFAAGGDLKHFLDILELPLTDQLSAFTRDYVDTLPFQSILDTPKPVIAKIDGLCFGGGVALAAVADVALASNVSTFGLPEAKVGTFDSLSPTLLPRIIGLARTRYLLMTGTAIDAETAAAWGLILRAVPSEDLESAVQQVAGELAMASPDSFRAYKTALNSDLRSGSSRLTLDIARSPNGLEGLRAFSEKRAPNWLR